MFRCGRIATSKCISDKKREVGRGGSGRGNEKRPVEGLAEIRRTKENRPKEGLRKVVNLGGKS